MMNEEITQSLLEEFVGCDSDKPGSAEFPAVWLFGIEPGSPSSGKNGKELDGVATNTESVDNSYSIRTQLGYRPFNQSAFKLLAAMNGYPVEQFRDFAERHQPFVRGLDKSFCDKLYFKGNLYPYACNKVDVWPEDAAKETGIDNKEEYRQWCREQRLPAIKAWVDKYQPRIFIGVGTTCRKEFSLAVFGREVEYQEKTITVNSYEKNIFFFIEGAKKLVVIPHFVGKYGLNSNQSLSEAGLFIAKLLKPLTLGYQKAI